MHLIGWSTGAILPKGDKANYPLAIELLKSTPFTCIELSVLREWELPVFLEYLPDLDTSSFDKVSFHCCKLKELTEIELFKKIEPVIEKGWDIINHPDLMQSICWKDLGNQILIENLENRKPTGRTVEEMEKIFEVYPDASMCFDIGHAQQVDPTMELGREMCIKFASKVKEIHLSEVDPISCAHKPINHDTLRAFGKITDVFPDCPIILECSPLTNLEKEVQYITDAFPLYGMDLKFRGKSTKN